MEVITEARTGAGESVQAAPLWLALVPEATCDTTSTDEIRVRWPGGSLTFPALTPGLRSALIRLAGAGSTEADLMDAVVGLDGAATLGRLYYHLDQLAGRGILTYEVRQDEEVVVRLRGMTPDFRCRPRPLESDTRLVMSRFAVLRRHGEGWMVESPLVPAELTGSSAVVPALMGRLTTPVTIGDLVAANPGLSESELRAVLQLLLHGCLDLVDAEGRTSDVRSDALVQWDVFDLLFHSRSRFGRHDRPFGATYRHLDAFAPRPGVRPARGGEMIELPVVNMDDVVQRDMSLTAAIETRVSTRHYGSPPISLQQLGEFLYRVARVRTSAEYRVPGGAPQAVSMDVTSRPYPSGGASYELEIYLVVDECVGLDRGMYHYHPADHRLELIRPADDLTERMLGFAGITAPGARPQVLLNIAARFQRISWKYDAIAYATIQKHVGIVYQTMYLVATAMGLGGCALGSGDADLFAKAARTNYYEETSVGDFMLGSLPPSDPQPDIMTGPDTTRSA